MKLSTSTILALLALLALSVQNAEAFVKGSAPSRTRPASTELYAVAKKTKKKKKKASKAKKASDVETMRKAAFVEEVAGRMDTTKVGAEFAVAAVLDTITEVRRSNIYLKFAHIAQTFSDTRMFLFPECRCW